MTVSRGGFAAGSSTDQGSGPSATGPIDTERPMVRALGGSFYEVALNGRVLGQVRPSPLSTASKPRWIAYRLNPNGYVRYFPLGPFGIDGWDRPTRREAIEQLVAAS